MTHVHIDQSRPSKTPLSGRVVAIIVASLCISIITLIICLILTSSFRRAWHETRDQIISAPEIDRNNAISTGRMADRADEIRTASVARAKLPQPRVLSPDEASHVVDLAQSQLEAKMSSAQVHALIKELLKPGQLLIDPAMPMSTSRSVLRGQPPFQLVRADTGGLGPGQRIYFETYRSYLSRDDHEVASLYIGLDGSISRFSVSSAADRASMVRRGATVQLTSSYIPQWQAEEKRDLGFALLSAIEFAVAVLLLFAGINAFCQKPR